MTNFIQFFKRNIEIIIINLLFLTFALLVFYLTGNKKEGNKEVSIAILVTGISLSIGIKQLQIENDKIFKELFTNFNSVYDAKFNNTLNRIDSNYKIKNTYILNDLKLQREFCTKLQSHKPHLYHNHHKLKLVWHLEHISKSVLLPL